MMMMNPHNPAVDETNTVAQANDVVLIVEEQAPPQQVSKPVDSSLADEKKKMDKEQADAAKEFIKGAVSDQATGAAQGVAMEISGTTFSDI
jgi:hypothetical protein